MTCHVTRSCNIILSLLLRVLHLVHLKITFVFSISLAVLFLVWVNDL